MAASNLWIWIRFQFLRPSYYSLDPEEIEKGGNNIPVGSLGGFLIGILSDYLYPCFLVPLVAESVAVCYSALRGACRGVPWCPFRTLPVCMVDLYCVLYKEHLVDSSLFLSTCSIVFRIRVLVQFLSWCWPSSYSLLSITSTRTVLCNLALVLGGGGARSYWLPNY